MYVRDKHQTVGSLNKRVQQVYYINTLQQELSGTKAYEQTFEKEKSVINNHIFHNANRIAVSVNEDQERVSTFYWLPKLHKKHIRLDLFLILANARLPNYPNCYPLVLLL